MRFLLDANMARSTLDIISVHDHQAEHVKNIGMGDAADQAVAAYAHSKETMRITRHLDFADLRSSPPERRLG